MPKYIVLYHDKKTPHLPTRVLTDKDGITRTFESEEDAEKERVVLSLQKGVSNTKVEKDGGQDRDNLLKAVEGAKHRVKESFCCPVCGRRLKKERK